MRDFQLVHSTKLYVAIGIGGMIGAIGRYCISVMFENNNPFPFATLITNIIGCFFLSFLLNHRKIKRNLSPEVFLAFSVGIIGAFTTFSTFAVETVELWSSNPYMAIRYVLLSVFGGLAFCYIGYKLAIGRQG